MKKNEIVELQVTQNEVRLSDLQVKYKLPQIKFDTTLLEKEVEDVIKKYSVQNQEADEAKRSVARLNTHAKELNDCGIKFDQIISQPIKDFRESLNVLVRKISKAAVDVKIQTDKYEADRKTAKRAEITKLNSWEPYMVFDEKWLQKTFLIKDIEANILDQKENFLKNVEKIEKTCESLGLFAEKYLKRLSEKTDIGAIIRSIENDGEVKKQYEKPIPIVVETIITTETVNRAVEVEDVRKTTIVFEASQVELQMLYDFANKNNIKYKKI